MLRAAVAKFQVDNGGGPLCGGLGVVADSSDSRAPQSLQDALYSPHHSGAGLDDSLCVSGNSSGGIAAAKGGPPLRIVHFLSSQQGQRKKWHLGEVSAL